MSDSGVETAQPHSRASIRRRAPCRLQFRDLGYDARAFGGPHQLEYTVQADPTDAPTVLPDATWADWDHRGRLVTAQHGRLVHWQSPETLVTLADFNGGSPGPTPAPDWARTWPP